MANVKISDLVAATVLAGADFVEVEQGGVSKRAPASLLGPTHAHDDRYFTETEADLRFAVKSTETSAYNVNNKVPLAPVASILTDVVTTGALSANSYDAGLAGWHDWRIELAAAATFDYFETTVNKFNETGAVVYRLEIHAADASWVKGALLRSVDITLTGAGQLTVAGFTFAEISGLIGARYVARLTLVSGATSLFQMRRTDSGWAGTPVGSFTITGIHSLGGFAYSVVTRIGAGPKAKGVIGPLDPADLPARALAPISVSFTANGDAYFPAHEAMTLNLASTTQAGTGTIAFAKALAATPTTFAAVSTSTSFAVGDVLRITCSAITGYKAVTVPRTA